MKQVCSFLLSLLISSSLILPDVAWAVVTVQKDQSLEQVDGGGGAGGGGSTPSGNSAGGSSSGSTSNSGGTAVQCSPENTLTPTGGFCCAGFKMDSGRKCIKDPTPMDYSLVSCDPLVGGTCQDGRACLKQSAESFFKYTPQNQSEVATQAAEESMVDNDAESGEPGALAVGKDCKVNSDCLSYNCESVPETDKYVCKDKFICRYGDETDTDLAATVKCDADLVNIGGVCKLKTVTDDPPVIGIIDADKKTIGDANKCELELDGDTKKLGYRALVAFRSMEYLLANFNASDDCMLINKHIREKIASDFLSRRRTILKNFNILMAQLEQDQQILLAASEKRKEEMLSIYAGADKEVMSSYDLATRRQSGFDVHNLMMKRNAAYRSYEYEMAKLAQEVAAKIKALNDDMGRWTDHMERGWTLAGSSYRGRDYKCRGGGFLNLGRRKIYKRWNKKIWVQATADNLKTIGDTDVLASLVLASGAKEAEIKTKLAGNANISFAGSNLFFGSYLIDPLIDLNRPGLAAAFKSVALPFGMNFGVYGAPASSGVLSMSSYKDVRTAIKLDYVSYFGSLKTDLGPAVQKPDPNLEKIISAANPQRPKGFIYEPELVKTQLRNCLNPAAGETPPADCSEVDKMLNSISAETLAAFIAWSQHNRGDYKFYFGNPKTWRRSLLSYWEKQLINASVYYAKTIDLRDKQDDCIMKYRDQSWATLLDGAGGIGTGTKNYYQEGTYIGNGTLPLNPKATTPRTKPLPPYAFDLKVDSFSINTPGNSKDPAVSVSGASSANIAAMEATAATRVKAMKATNAKLAAKGVNIADKEAEYKATIDSMAGGAGGAGSFGSMGAGASASKSSTPSLSNTSNSNAAPDTKKDAASKGLGEGVSGGATSGAGAGAGEASGVNGQGIGAFGNYGSALTGSSSDAMSGASGGYQDPTGMSNEDKDVILANIERNKSKYKRNEEDNLFTIISKQYANSLPKILTKKKIED